MGGGYGEETEIPTARLLMGRCQKALHVSDHQQCPTFNAPQ